MAITKKTVKKASAKKITAKKAIVKKIVKKPAKISISKIDKIMAALDKVRPALQMDGGDLQYVSYNEKSGILEIRLIGMCAHCPMSQITLKQGIEAEVKKAVKEVKKVMAV